MEIWKDVPGYEGLYKGSNLGNVKSLGNMIGNNSLERNLKPQKNKFGYFRVGLSKEGKQKLCFIHRIISLTFIENPEDKSQINHKNGIRDDNRLENLEWCTASENIQHSFNSLGRESTYKGKIGILNHLSKRVIQSDKKDNIIKIWDSIHCVTRELGINDGNISSCCKGRYGFKSAGGYKWKFEEEVKEKFFCDECTDTYDCMKCNK